MKKKILLASTLQATFFMECGFKTNHCVASSYPALKEVEMMLQHQMNLQVPSVSTTNNAEKLQAVVISSCETPCPDVGK